MSCEFVADVASLAPNESPSTELETHVRTCSVCGPARRIYQLQDRDIGSTYEAMPVPPPRQRRPPRPLATWPTMTVAAALLLGAVLVGLGLGQFRALQPPTPEQPVVSSTAVPDCAVAPGLLLVGAEELAAMAVPQSELGAQYAELVLDTGFGGFVGNLDEAFRGTDYVAACADARASGRLAGYSGLYRSPTGGPAYIQTAVTLYRDTAGASAAYAKTIDTQKNRAGTANGDVINGAVTEFTVPAIGDDVHGYVTELNRRADGTSLGAQTRVTLKRGRLIGWANTTRVDRDDVTAEIIALAQRLDARITAVLRGEIDAYAGVRPQQRISAEQLAQMHLSLGDLGADYAAWTWDFGASEFTSNESLMESYRGSTIDGTIRTITRDTGRVTGYAFPFSNDDNRTRQQGAGYLTTGVHLFATPDGARRYVALFRDAEATMVTSNPTGSVESTNVAGIGDSALLMVTRYSNGNTRTRILFVRGRLSADIFVFRFDSKDVGAEMATLARKLDARIQEILKP